MSGVADKRTLLRLLQDNPAMLDRARLLLSQKPTADAELRAEAGLSASSVFEMSIHEDEFAALLSGRMDPGTVRSVSVSPPDKITFFKYADRVFEVFFYLYNVDRLGPQFGDTLIERIYDTGKISDADGIETPIYPWAIAADLGVCIHNFVLERGLENTLEIGLAYGLSALFLCDAHRRRGSGSHTAIDPGQRANFANCALENVRKSGLERFFVHIDEPDYSALPGLLRTGKKFDLIFIDGLHLFDYVLLDFFYADLLLTHQGYLAFDDSVAPAVEPVIRFIETNRSYKRIPTSIERLTLFQKVDEDRRFLGDPSGFTEFPTGGSRSDAGFKPPRNAKSHQDLIAGFARRYDDLISSGRIDVSRAWEFAIKLTGREHSAWRISVSSAGVRCAHLANDEAVASTDCRNVISPPQPTRPRLDAYEKIAVVGLSARHPKSPNIDRFWENLLKQAPLFSEVPAERWSWHDYYGDPAEDSGRTWVNSGGFLDDVYEFDAEFFSVSPREAALMDPHQRLLLEEVYRCTEDAGYAPEQLEGARTGVFIAIAQSSYLRSQANGQKNTSPHVVTGDSSFTANRISYFLNVSGPSETIYTACSSFSVALHRAAIALQQRECDIALVGTASLEFSVDSILSLSQMGVLSQRGICAPFNGDVSGLVPGEAVGVVMLKRLQDAVADRDNIYGAIAGSGTNHAGNLSGSLTLTNSIAQSELITRVLREAQFGPEQIDYIEGHGTGGFSDSLELDAVCKAFSGRPKIKGALRVGSVKSYVGFSGAACGLTQLIRILLMMRHGAILPTLNFECSPPAIDLKNAGISIPGELQTWAREAQGAADSPRRAGMHSYGLGGSGAFLVIEEWIEEPREETTGAIRHIPLSARTEAQLKSIALNLATHLRERAERNEPVRLADLSCTLQAGRKPMEFRLLISADSMEAFQRKLDSFLADKNENVDWFRGRREAAFVGSAEDDESSTGDPGVDADAALPGSLWLKGHGVDWGRIQRSDGARKVSLPTYPFEKRTFRISAGQSAVSLRSLRPPQLRQQSAGDFATDFASDEIYLLDHVVRGQKLLPGAVSLELARTAVAQFLPKCESGRMLCLADLVWIRPVVVPDRPLQIKIKLSIDARGKTAFEVFRQEDDADRCVYVRGLAAAGIEDGSGVLDLPGLRARMSVRWIAGAECYAAFRGAGIEYGPSLQCIRAIQTGDREALAQLHLPEFVAGTLDDFVLHPSLIDAAFQSLFGMVAGSPEKDGPQQKSFTTYLPFAIDRIDVLDKCEIEMFVWMRPTPGHGSLGDPAGKIDVDLCDSRGRVCVRFRGILARPVRDAGVAGEEGFRSRALAWFKQLIASTLNVPSPEIDETRPLESYGLDSILVVELTRAIRKHGLSANTTLFFEVRTVKAIAGYFIENHSDELARILSLEDGPDHPPPLIDGPREKSPSMSEPAGAAQPVVRVASVPQPASSRLPQTGEIAIIGLAGRYPKAGNASEFWNNLKEGINCISEIPPDRWDWRDYFDQQIGKPGCHYTKWGGFIDDVARFDARFFRISPRDAINMDPQERLFLEVAYASIQDAGYTPATLCPRRKVGVFAGVMNGVYSPKPSYWSIANRVSWVLDFRGPSLAVDTACSSSLTAIHLAAESLYSGLSEIAIAGGVNLILDPIQYLGLSEMTMLSPTNQCKPFGAQADGFVDGEGVGALVLKPLERAVADGDQIYGVLKGSALNSGGRTGGYTVPDPIAQSELVLEVMKRAGVSPDSVSYLEAHGTGTALGDPLEIAALTRAFQHGGNGRNRLRCAIGSVKSNIGHCESAAGVAGLTKVLLQLKYGQLAPSLHSGVLNPHIDFNATPFVVNRELRMWERPVIDGKTLPRRAGVSSFGAGGANAHIIVEEFVEAGEEPRKIQADTSEPCVVVLSAMNEDRLKESARILLRFVQEHPSLSLPDLAYTLQLGREAMEERMGLLVSSLVQLEENLKEVIGGQNDMDGYYRGRAAESKNILSVFADDLDLAAALERWIEGRKFSRLLDYWVKGLEIDWLRLYKDSRPRRISLPTYPFSGERFWWEKPNGVRETTVLPANRGIHPLLHENTSDLSEQRFTSTFTGTEFFLCDHQVAGRMLLPGVAYLEMARVAAVCSLSRASSGINLENITWLRPFESDGRPRSIHVALIPQNDGRVRFEIYSRPSEFTDERLVHCQGRVSLCSPARSSDLDIPALQTSLDGSRLTPAECYEAYEALEICYGIGHRTIAEILVGKNELLAKLVLPAQPKNADDRFVLHPSMLDGAWQASIGFVLNTRESGAQEPFLPYALDSLEIFDKCAETMWAWVRRSGHGASEVTTGKVDIDLCDDLGVVCVRMKGLSSRPMTASTKARQPQQPEMRRPSAKVTMLTPVWNSIQLCGSRPESLPIDAVTFVINGNLSQRQAIQAACSRVVECTEIEGDSIDEIARRLSRFDELKHVIWIAPHSDPARFTGDAILRAQNGGLFALFRLVKALISLGYGSKKLELTVITAGTQKVFGHCRLNPAHAGVHGLIGSFAAEYRHWTVRLADLEHDGELPFAELLTLPVDAGGGALARRGGEWFRQSLSPLSQGVSDHAYRRGGVYVVIGGAGGIGEAWSRFMLEQHGAHIIWLGRREKDRAIENQLDALSGLGASIDYIQADASDRASLLNARDEIKEKHAAIHGVVHSAIVLSDKGLETMDESAFLLPLKSKVDASIHLAEVFRKEALDFVMFFSSMIAFQGRPGQSNYASGCAFADAYATYMGETWRCPVKIMNWGYWGSIGIKADPSSREAMRREGLDSIEPSEGMAALDCLLSAPVHRVAFVKTMAPELNAILVEAEAVTAYPRSIPSAIGAIGQPASNEDPEAVTIASVIGPQNAEMEVPFTKLLWAALLKLRLFNESCAQLAGIHEQTRKLGIRMLWFEESLRVLEDRNYLRREGERLRIIASPVTFEKALSDWNEAKAAWKDDANRKSQIAIIDACAPALPDLITGRRPVTEVLFPDSSMELVEGIYAGNAVSSHFNKALANCVRQYVDERVCHNPDARIRILEIGGGTGATTSEVLERLGSFTRNIETYCFTDLSDVFLLRARARFGPSVPFFTTQVFDIGEAIAGQRIPADHFDIVIATNVVHATRSIRESLRNAKAAMKHNGVLLLNELGANSLFFHLSFAFLDGWWLFEDSPLRMPGCPCLSSDTWARVLEEEGFTSVTFPIRPAHVLGQQLIVAESDGIVRQRMKPGSPKPRQRTLPNTNAGKQPVDPQLAPNRLSGSPESPALTRNMIEGHANQVIRESIAAVLKMTEAEIQDDLSFSEYGIDSIVAVQLINRINDRFGLVLQTTVLFDHPNVDLLGAFLVNSHGSAIGDDLRKRTGFTAPQPSEPVMASAHANRFSRGVEEPAAFREAAVRQVEPRTREVINKGSKTVTNDAAPLRRRVVIDGPGEVDGLRIVEDTVPELQPGDVRIAVHAFSMNFGDLLCVRGLYPTMPPYPFTPGFDAAGTVVEVGDAVTLFRPGDAVVAAMGKTLGAHATVVTCPEDDVQPMHPKLNFEGACALPIVAITMIDAFRKANLKPGERILIQTAAGGAGLIAVQLAGHAGAEIFATASSQAKLDYLARRGVHHGINYHAADFESEIMRLTKGQGVDVVINTLPGDAISKGMRCLAAGGRYIELAMTALKSAKSIDLSVLSNNQSFFSVDLRKLGLENAAKASEYRAEFKRLLDEGVISATIHKVFEFDRILDAYRALENRGNIGKIVVRVPESYRFGNARQSIGRSSSPAGAPLKSADRPEKGSIAIVGMSGRFAQSENLDAFWEHLAAGDNLVKPIDRWDLASSEDSLSAGHYASLMKDIDLFDREFFRISGIEARYMDPQQRLFLEQCWIALENGGFAGAKIEGSSCGIYVGCSAGDYQMLFKGESPAQAFWGNANSLTPSRIAYYLNLQGPAVAVDTGCSSSLVAIHLACQALWSHETEIALAGGVFIQCTPAFHLSAHRAGMLSPVGQCRAFDAGAAGFVSGEGVGAIVLKRLSDALAAGDHIHGVIRGISINQDGRSNGITAPSLQAQERLEREVYERFGIDPGGIQLIEAHGTGTSIGDPVEFEALDRAFRRFTRKERYCALGSVKTNIGHTTSAAGIAGVLKVLLSLKHKRIPPSLHYKRGNPRIAFDGSPFYVNTELRDWTVEAGERRRAAVSSFSFNGTNAHIVIEEAPEAADRKHAELPGCLVPLSAQSTEQLRRQVENLLGFCRSETDFDLGNLSHTLFVGRKHWNHRWAFVARNSKELVPALEQWLAGNRVEKVCVSESARGERPGHTSLEKFGERCIQTCLSTKDHAEYLENLEALADLYVQRCDLDYGRLFGSGFSTIPLPAYPFSRERCWVNEVTPSRSSFAPVNGNASSATLLFKPVWRTLPRANESHAEPLACSPHFVLLWNPRPGLPQAIEARFANSKCVSLQAGPGHSNERFLDCSLRVFETIREILKQRPASAMAQVVAQSGSVDASFRALSGLLMTARLEYPGLRAQLIEVERMDSTDSLISNLEECLRYPEDVCIRYEQGQRRVPAWEELPDFNQTGARRPWKNGGVYLITGGAGRLGLIFAKEIARQTSGSKIILTGRSELPSPDRAFMEQLAATGATVEYRRADVGHRKEVEDLVRGIAADFGTIDGIVHGAGIHRDRLILNKPVSEIEDVFSPKVSGAVHLDEATMHMALDFFVCFSSCAAVLGNPGQADYAAANAFLDAYLSDRDRLVASGKRHGRSLSVNWPLWKEGGMQIDAASADAIRKSLGMVAMDTQRGIRSFYQTWNSGQSQILVIDGDPELIRQRLLPKQTSFAATPAPGLFAKTEQRLKDILAGVIDVPPHRIDAELALDEYGIDSLMIETLNKRLGEVFNEVSKTLFFEFRTLASIARHLLDTYPETCAAWSARQNPATSSDVPKIESLPKPAPAVPSHGLAQEPIAIVGIDGRYPQAGNLDAYWKNLSSGKDCVTEIPEDRWPLDGFFYPDVREAIATGRSYSKWGGFLEGFADFDPLFFRISPLEAVNMDPQERLFLECAWNVLEEAGYTREALERSCQGRVGVFAGITKTGFDLYGPNLWNKGQLVYPRTSFGSVANRISWFLDLKGPSMPIDTMCSSSLTAIHEACEHIRHGECDMAIAGGVNLYLHPSNYVEMCAVKMLSKDGKCRSFGKGGDGFVPGEGVGAVLLKRLDRAIEDGDHIHAVIRGSSVNHGGKTNGYTVPNPAAQAKLIRETLDKAGIHARTVSYIEAHGTGTELGDPIETTGLTQAFERDTTDIRFCALGSAKSNLGHLEAAAGIAGLTKVVLQMKHGQLAPSLNAGELNPNIAFEKTPFIVQRELSPWLRPVVDLNGKTTIYPRIAGVSSFGAGGANAHLVIEEYIDADPSDIGAQTGVDGNRSKALMIPLSARNSDRLRARAANLLSYLQATHLHGSHIQESEPFAHRGAHISESIGALLASILDVEPRDIGFEQPLQDFGVEPIQQIQLRDRIQDSFHIELSWSDFRDLDSVQSIGAYLLQNHPAAIDANRPTLAENNRASEPTSIRLEDLAYTLQAGREAMEERAAFIVQSCAELVSGLHAIASGAEASIPIHRGTIKPGRTKQAEAPHNQEPGESMLQAWVKGARVDFSLLYPGRKPRRISLPGYPFAAERFWPESAAQQEKLSAKPASNGNGLNGFHENSHEAILDRLIAGSISVDEAMKIVADS